MDIKLLSIGMNYSKIAGNCPGAELDASRMYDLIKDRCVWSDFLKNESATKENVIEGMKKICDSDLAILFYAGHGASKRMKLSAPEEADGNDEMICLYDNLLMDDEIWDVLSKARGRVFCIFDCCHSETMFRVGKKSLWDYLLSFLGINPEEKIVRYKPISFNNRDSENVDLMCWSGCADDKTSLGSSSGGVFTNAFLKHYDKNLTYEEMWSKLIGDQFLNKREVIKRTILMGEDSSFFGKSVFE